MLPLVKRLVSNDDLRNELEALAAQSQLEAGIVVSAVGSLMQARLRLAGADVIKTIQGPLEIVSATGTISKHGMHVHVSVSDESGVTTGGHLVSGCMVHTTVELVILPIEGWKFDRHEDASTKYKELKAERLDKQKAPHL